MKFEKITVTVANNSNNCKAVLKVAIAHLHEGEMFKMDILFLLVHTYTYA